MTRRIVSVVARAFTARTTTTTEHPHFHQGAQGNPAACFEPRCDRPQLEV